MRVIRRGALVAALAAAVLVPIQANALLQASCGGSYSKTTTCLFNPVGPNIVVSGTTSASSITVRITDPSGTVRLLSCWGSSRCSAEAGLPRTDTDHVGPPAGNGQLLCTVITSGSGTYRCQSTA